MDNLRSKTAKVGLATVVLVGALLSGSMAFAAPADPGGTGTAMTSLGGDIEEWVQTYAIPVIIALLLVGVGVRLLVRFTRKATGMVG